ncbi:signal recognition particle-docking protein FtsY [bacterium]|nr:signal recognition particle-docking protein FtsY [bacterium]
MSSLWRDGLGKTRKGLVGRITGLFKNTTVLDDDILDDLEELLIESDIGVDTAMVLIEGLRKRISGLSGDMSQKIKEALRLEIEAMLPDSTEGKDLRQHHPHVILVVGVNGSGKTTTLGKLAGRYHKAGKKVMLVGADTFRAAAAEQLQVWADRSGSMIIRQAYGSDPASVAYDGMDAAIARDVDVVLIDTAGRLQNKVNLMEELRKIRRTIHKRMPDAPHDVLLVLDANTGQNGLAQAKIFTEAVDVTEIALTKLDGTARGGIVLAVQRETGIPVRWAGLGEGMEDLLPFDAAEFVEGLFSDNNS